MDESRRLDTLCVGSGKSAISLQRPCQRAEELPCVFPSEPGLGRSSGMRSASVSRCCLHRIDDRVEAAQTVQRTLAETSNWAPGHRSILLRQHYREDARCLARIRRVVRAELQVGIEIIDLPEEPLGSMMEGAEVVLPVRVVVASALIERAHFGEYVTDAVLPEGVDAGGDDQVSPSEAHAKRVVQSGDDCRAIGHDKPPCCW